MTFQEFLQENIDNEHLDKWTHCKTFTQFYNECQDGGMLCWLYFCSPGYNLRKLTLVKGHQAKQVEHLMKDERSRQAVHDAIKFGNGEIDKNKLDAAADEAMYAVADVQSLGLTIDDYVANAAYAAVNEGSKQASNFVAHSLSVITEEDYEEIEKIINDYKFNDTPAMRSAGCSILADIRWNESLKKSADIFRKYISIDDFKFDFK